MTLERPLHQNPGRPGRDPSGAGEAQAAASLDEARSVGHELEGLGRQDLLTQALSRENSVKAWKRVKANKGSASVDGSTIEQTIEHLKTHWRSIRQELLDGKYRPQAVRRVEIPEPAGGVRELGTRPSPTGSSSKHCYKSCSH